MSLSELNKTTIKLKRTSHDAQFQNTDNQKSILKISNSKLWQLKQWNITC